MAVSVHHKPAPTVVIRNATGAATVIPTHNQARITADVPEVAGYIPVGIVGVLGIATCYIMTFYFNSSTSKANADVYNFASSDITITPTFVVIYEHV